MRGENHVGYRVRLTLADPPLDGRSGRGVLVAVIDSGIHEGHPHVGTIGAGVTITDAGEEPGAIDRLGHGTAVAAAIREKAPGAELLAVKVFDRSLATTAEVLARAIVWSADNGARLINLSLGTTNLAREAVLAGAVRHAATRHAIVVSARTAGDLPALPGSLDSVIGVTLDWACDRDAVELLAGGTLRASPYPRPIPGVPRERNLRGISFAVANVTGFLARVVEAEPGIASAHELREALARLRT